MKIAISGFAGSGKTSLAKQLEKKLKSLNLSFELITPSFKDYAKEKGLSLMEVQKLAEEDKTLDLSLDRWQKEKAEKCKNCIIASWLAIWLIEKAELKVFLYSPLEERARRVAKRDSLSFERALEHVKKRDAMNIKRYKALYSIDITRFYEVAHLVLNSSFLSLEEEVELILSYLNISRPL